MPSRAAVDRERFLLGHRTFGDERAIREDLEVNRHFIGLHDGRFELQRTFMLAPCALAEILTA